MQPGSSIKYHKVDLNDYAVSAFDGGLYQFALHRREELGFDLLTPWLLQSVAHRRMLKIHGWSNSASNIFPECRTFQCQSSNSSHILP